MVACTAKKASYAPDYPCNQCLSPLTLWVRIQFRRGVIDTTLCDQVCQWPAAGRWFSPGTPVSYTNKTDHHDITEILLKVALNTIPYPLKGVKLVFTLETSIIDLLYSLILLTIIGFIHMRNKSRYPHRNRAIFPRKYFMVHRFE